jgi:uncharacterized SAM-binding protein YcdF (DUF218 family)
VGSKHRRLIGLGVVLVALVLSYPWWILLPGTILVKSSEPQPAEAVFVLGGDTFGFRVKGAADLVHRGIAPLVLVSGNDWYFGLWECELAIDQAVKNGQPREIFEPFRHNATSTDDELRKIFAEAQRRGWKSIILVTSNFHTRRTGLLVRRNLPEGLHVQVVASEDRYFRPEEWWWHRESRKLLVMEWMKMGAALLGGL